MTKPLNWKIWTGLLISALFAFLALRDVEMARMWVVIKSAKPLFLFIVIVLTFFQFVVR